MAHTTDKEQAGRMATEDILRGNIDGARRWALEYAEHRDNERTNAELDVCIEFWAEYRLQRGGGSVGDWFPGERVDAD